MSEKSRISTSVVPRSAGARLFGDARSLTPTILLLDNDDCIRDALKRILERGGYSVLGVRDRAEAVALALDCDIELLVLDRDLFQSNGIEILGDLMSHGHRPLQVLCLSDQSPDEERSSGALHYMARPVKRKEFLARVQSILAEA